MIGPNGGGKSTLKTAVDCFSPSVIRPQLLARPPKGREGFYLPQREEVDWAFPISVLEVVLQGRLVRLGWRGRLRREDYAASREALRFFGLDNLEEVQIGSLSGGQRQRVFLARALVQEADLILLDEPAAGLDAKAQHELADLLVSLRDAGKTIIAATHDLDCLTECFDQVLAPEQDGFCRGRSAQVLTEETMVKLFAGIFPKWDQRGGHRS